MKQISQELYQALQKEFGAKDDRFIDNGDSTVTDTKEKLMWEQASLGERFTWQEAMELKSDLAGYSDWRLPTIHELFSLVDFSEEKDKQIYDVFDIADQVSFWSSTTSSGNTSRALGVGFTYGYVDSNNKSSSGYVRLVRSM